MFRILTLASLGIFLSACSSNPPEDSRYEKFGTGLPEQHNEENPAPYPSEAFKVEANDLKDRDEDGVINHRDECEQTKDGAALTNEGCEETFSKIDTIDLGINFASGSAVIEQKYEDNIKKVAQLHQQNKDFVILIEGHTDSTGSASKNKSLSKERADAVAKILIEKFETPADDVLTAGFGADRPIASNDTAEGRKKNRRMVAHLVTRERLVKKRYNIWAVDLGDKDTPEVYMFETP